MQGCFSDTLENENKSISHMLNTVGDSDLAFPALEDVFQFVYDLSSPVNLTRVLNELGSKDPAKADWDFSSGEGFAWRLVLAHLDLIFRDDNDPNVQKLCNQADLMFVKALESDDASDGHKLFAEKYCSLTLISEVVEASSEEARK